MAWPIAPTVETAGIRRGRVAYWPNASKADFIIRKAKPCVRKRGKVRRKGIKQKRAGYR